MDIFRLTSILEEKLKSMKSALKMEIMNKTSGVTTMIDDGWWYALVL